MNQDDPQPMMTIRVKTMDSNEFEIKVRNPYGPAGGANSNKNQIIE